MWLGSSLKSLRPIHIKEIFDLGHIGVVWKQVYLFTFCERLLDSFQARMETTSFCFRAAKRLPPICSAKPWIQHLYQLLQNFSENLANVSSTFSSHRCWKKNLKKIGFWFLFRPKPSLMLIFHWCVFFIAFGWRRQNNAVQSTDVSLLTSIFLSKKATSPACQFSLPMLYYTFHLIGNNMKIFRV